MMEGKTRWVVICLGAFLLVSSVVTWVNSWVTADEIVGADVIAEWVDSWMEEQPSIPANADKLIQFNRDQPNDNAYHLGDMNVNVWITLKNIDAFDNIYVGDATLLSNNALFTPNQDQDDGHTIPAGWKYTFHFSIDIGTNGNVNDLYQNALGILLENMEQPMGNNIGNMAFNFDIYVSSIFDPDSGDSQTDLHENLSDIHETDANPDFEPGENLQEGRIQLTNHAGYSISDIEANLDVSGIPEDIFISGGNNLALDPGPISADGGNLELFWNFDLYPTVPPDYYMPELEISYNRSDTGAIIVENHRQTGINVAPSTIATGPVGGPSNEAEINISYSMTGTPPNVTLYYTQNSSAPYSWNLIDTDITPDGFYDWTVPLDGSYGWYAISENETAPNSSTPPEASSYIYDGTSPGVESTNPVNSADEVPVESDIEIIFEEAMNTTSFLYTIEPDPGGLSVGWGSSNKSAKLSHSDFLSGSRYWVNITSATDRAGNVLDQLPYSFFFDTVDISSKATATGPTEGPTNISDITITYTTENSPAGVELFYTTNTSSPYQWTSIDTDSPADGSYDFTLPGTGSYGWNAVATDESPPSLIDAPEAGYYIYDDIQPEVISTIPVSGDFEVGLGNDIIIFFNEEMNTTAFIYSLEPNPGGISVVWNLDYTNVTISHIPFSANLRYWINITSLEDLAGNHMVTLPHSVYFDTVVMDMTPPTIVSNSPTGRDVDTDSDIEITFSEGMDPEAVETAFSYTDGITVWDKLDGTVQWDATNVTMTFDPSVDLDYNVTYSVHIESSARDTAGNSLQSFNWTFSVKPEPDTAAPVILDVSPAVEDIELIKTITFEFSEPMNRSSVENALSISPESPEVTLRWDDDNLTISIQSDLKPGTEYRFTIGIGARDEAGNTLSEPYILTFTTEESPEEESNIMWLVLILIIIVIVVLLLLIFRKRKPDEHIEDISKDSIAKGDTQDFKDNGEGEAEDKNISEQP